MRSPIAALPRTRERGAGLIETMVAIVIGMLVVLVVYNMLSLAEGYKRTTTGLADAQITGLLAHFIVSQDAANAGNGVTSGADVLKFCTKDEAGVATTIDNTLLPIGLIITEAGATAKDSDAFVARQSSSPHVVWGVPLRPLGGDPTKTTVAPGGDIQVQSPTGFMTPAKASLPTAAKPWWAVMVANDGTGKCGLIQIQSATPDANMDTTGEVLLKQGAIQTTIDYKGVPQNDTGTGAYLLNLGRDEAMRRVRYEVNPTTPPAIGATQRNQLLVTDCSDPAQGCAAGVRNPIAANIALMKVQYGIDTTVLPGGLDVWDGTVDCWTPGGTTPAGPTGTTCPIAALGMVDWSPASILGNANVTGGNPARVLNRLLAVRVGIVVASEEPDLRDPALVKVGNSTIDGAAGTRPDMYLFNCTANTDAGCPNRVKVPAGAGSAAGRADCAAASAAVLCDGFRYRTYEVVIPLRNNIFSATLPP